METTFGQPQPLKGLSQFLVEHEQCGAGFDVSHPAGLGSGKVSMTCRGCGANYEYATATIEFEREIEFEPVTVRRPPAPQAAPPPPPPPAPPSTKSDIAPVAAAAAATGPLKEIEEGTPPAPKEPKAKRGEEGGEEAKKKRSRDRAIAAGLLVLATAAMAFAVYRVTHQGEESTAPESPPAAVTPPAQTASPKPQPAAKPPADTPSKAEPKQPQGQPSAPLPGEKRIKEEHFELIVPDSWTEKSADGGSLFAPAGDSPVSVQVFYENDPGMSEDTMASQTAAFLRSRDPSATVGSPQDRSIEGQRAFELHAVGTAGTQVALGVLAGDYRYLVIENADPGTSPALRREADRVMSTFRPR